MASHSDVVAAWPSSVGIQAIVKLALGLLFALALRFLYTGVKIRLQFRKLIADGQPVIAPHSFLLGHLPLVAKLGEGLPSDVHRNYRTRYFGADWKTYFPHLDGPPAVIYMDFWPIAPEPIILIRDADTAATITAGRFPRRHEQTKYLGRATAGRPNLFEWEGDVHKTWRARLNPGFSTRSLQMHIQGGTIVDDLVTFADRMRRAAGPNGSWGAPFQMYPKAVDLTFDIICGIAIGFTPGEQKNGPTQIQKCLKKLIEEYFFLDTLFLLPKRLNPMWHIRYKLIHKELDGTLLPHVERTLNAFKSGKNKGPKAPRTVLDLALKEMQDEGVSETGKKNFITDALGLVKQFIFAGHETTSITFSFAVHYLSRRPDFLQQVRDEHDNVFGKDLNTLPDTIRASSHLLNSLPYTTAVLKETLRLTAIASSIRNNESGFVLADPKTGTQYPTPDGFILVSASRSVHYNPSIFPRPREFLPERWLAGVDDPLHVTTDGHVFRPFELGPMSCIGQELAMMELKMALIFTAREFDFEEALEQWDALHGRTEPRILVDGDKIYQTNVAALGTPTEELPMRVRLRQR